MKISYDTCFQNLFPIMFIYIYYIYDSHFCSQSWSLCSLEVLWWLQQPGLVSCQRVAYNCYCESRLSWKRRSNRKRTRRPGFWGMDLRLLEFLFGMREKWRAGSWRRQYYCCWKRSKNTWEYLGYINLVNTGINYISTGAGFLPSTV